MSSVLSIAASGMNAATRRLETSARSVADGEGDLAGEAVEQIVAGTSFAANARVAKIAADTLKTLLDIKV